MPEPVEPSTPALLIPPLDAPATEQPTASTASIAAHSATFNPQVERPAPEPAKEPERERHRAQSQKATAADVPRINELTKKLRAAEAELERIRASAPAKTEPVAASPVAVVAPKTAPAGDGFPDPEPTMDQFLSEPDPYGAWNRATARWDRKKDAWDEKSAERATAAQRAEQAVSNTRTEVEEARTTAYRERLDTFVQTHPDFTEKFQAATAVDDNLPPAVNIAILEDDNGPAILYHLLTHPDDLDSVRVTYGLWTPTDYSVALLRRRLQSYASQAATTGSAGSATAIVAPRPPNPVRTGPMKTSDPFPGDTGSIADHARAYDPKRRR